MAENKKIKHVVFDLDGTLTKSRSVISRDMTESLRELEGLYDVVIISGGQKSQMVKQIPWLEDSLFTIMSQSGCYAEKEGEVLWEKNLSIQDLQSVLLHLDDIEVGIRNDMLEIRGGQASYSFIGHGAAPKQKKNFDPDGKFRRELLGRTPYINPDMMVRIGGTTCLDYTRNGWGKRGNLEELFKLNNWDFKDAIFFGDQLFEGGNDADVKHIMESVEVRNPNDTHFFITKELL